MKPDLENPQRQAADRERWLQGLGFGLLLLLLLASLVSAVATGSEWCRLVRHWHGAGPWQRELILYGEFAPVIAKVRREVAPAESILLFSAVDPALLPYALFPRPILQVSTDPETNADYMNLPESPYGRRPVESFAAVWRLDLTPENLGDGGTLRPFPARTSPPR